MTLPQQVASAEMSKIDLFAWKLASKLLEDFKPFVDETFHQELHSDVLARNVVGFRSRVVGDLNNLQPYELKCRRQLIEVFKKFSFSKDLYTPDEIKESSILKFMENQDRIKNMHGPLDREVNSVLFGARGWAEQILGDFAWSGVLERVRFGKKSTVGIPMRKACEGSRYEAPITGSSAHIQWFRSFYKQWDRAAVEYAAERAALVSREPFREVDILEAVLVDKTWKSNRMIMPNTTLGSFYSAGLGVLLEDKLRSFGYDIKHLQDVHGELARFGSITGTLVTADQSLASDNLTTWLVDRILPDRWASALRFGRIGEIALYGRKVETPTFSTMGIGFTFPLQTLVFLVLLLAIREQRGLDETHVVSVFGDDLIYDVEMHELVVRVFSQLGLAINEDKTFASGHFRESCGRDYYRGIDVRPFHLGRASTRDAGRRRFEAYLYKTINGLSRRWSAFEIPETYTWLLQEIKLVRGGNKALRVPADFPDTSGVKTSDDTCWFEDHLERPKRDRHGTYRFRYLAFEAEKQTEERHWPYLHRKLKGGSTIDVVAHRALLMGGLNGKSGVILEDQPPVFSWEEDTRELGNTRFRKEMRGGRRHSKTPMIPKQDKGRYRERSGVSVRMALEKARS